MDEIPYTLSTVEVVRTLVGQQPPATLRLRQLGTGTSSTDKPVVRSDHVYLAYIQPFTYGSGPVSDEWVVIGGLQGLYDYAGARPPAQASDRAFQRVDPEPDVLPAQVSVTDAAGG